MAVGANAVGEEPLDRSLDYVHYQHATLRALEVVSLVGAAPVRLEPRLAVTRDDRERARTLLRPLLAAAHDSVLLAVHPGATDPRRRWPTGWFGDIVNRAVRRGWHVAVVGGEADRKLAREVVGEAVNRGTDCRRVLDLTGATDLPALIGILERADVLVGNDSAPRHIAQAVGTPTVSVYWAGDAMTEAPLSRSTHRVHLGWVSHCPVCGADATRPSRSDCGHSPSFVAAVPVEPVWDDVEELVAAAKQPAKAAAAAATVDFTDDTFDDD